MVVAKVKHMKAMGKLRNMTFLQARAEATLALVTMQSKNAIGQVARELGTATDNTRRMVEAQKDLSIAFGAVILPLYTKITLKITNYIRALEDTSPATKELILKIAAIIAIVGPLLILLGLAASGFAVLLSGVKVLAGGFALLSVASGSLTGVITILNAAMMANPIGFIVGMIAIAAAGFYAFRQEIGRFINKWAGLAGLSLPKWARDMFGMKSFSGGGDASSPFDVVKNASSITANKPVGINGMINNKSKVDVDINLQQVPGFNATAKGSLTGLNSSKLGFNMGGMQ